MSNDYSYASELAASTPEHESSGSAEEEYLEDSFAQDEDVSAMLFSKKQQPRTIRESLDVVKSKPLLARRVLGDSSAYENSQIDEEETESPHDVKEKSKYSNISHKDIEDSIVDRSDSEYSEQSGESERNSSSNANVTNEAEESRILNKNSLRRPGVLRSSEESSAESASDEEEAASTRRYKPAHTSEEEASQSDDEEADESDIKIRRKIHHNSNDDTTDESDSNEADESRLFVNRVGKKRAVIKSSEENSAATSDVESHEQSNQSIRSSIKDSSRLNSNEIHRSSIRSTYSSELEDDSAHSEDFADLTNRITPAIVNSGPVTPMALKEALLKHYPDHLDSMKDTLDHEGNSIHLSGDTSHSSAITDVVDDARKAERTYEKATITEKNRDLSVSIEEIEGPSIDQMPSPINVSSSSSSDEVEELPSPPKIVEPPKFSMAEVLRMRSQLQQKEMTARMVGLRNLPDGGEKLFRQIEELKEHLAVADRQEAETAYGAIPKSTHTFARPMDNLTQDQLRKKVQTAKWALGSATGAEKDRLRDELREMEGQLLRMTIDEATAGSSQQGRPQKQQQQSAFKILPDMPRMSDAQKRPPASKSGGVKYLAEPLQPLISDKLTAMQKRLLSDQPAEELYKRLESGHITAASKRQAESVTLEALENLHRSLANMPAETDREPTPSCLTVPLLPHQERGLKWLLWRETQNPPGGILADDMGLGKTLNMISLIVAQKERDPPPPQSSDLWLSKTVKIKRSSGTLVVCPASVVGQWENEINRRCKRNALSVVQFHGPARDKLASTLHRYDVVITTYQIITREIMNSGVKDKGDQPIGDFDPETQAHEMRQSVLLRIAFNRIILDEAHVIRNPKSGVSQAVCRLRAVRRWAVTGTPVQNKELDMYSLLRFLRISPFDQLPIWKRWVDSSKARADVHASERLQLLIKTLLLRRTKDQKGVDSDKPLVDMPKKDYYTHQVKLTTEENEVYQKILDFSRAALEQYIKSQERKAAEEITYSYDKRDGPKQKTITKSHILLLLLRLRQVCSHPALLRTMIEKAEAEDLGAEGGKIEGEDEDLISKLSGMKIDSDREKKEQEKNFFTFSNPIFDQENVSSKMQYVIDEVKKVVDKGQKAVVVSQWTSMLDVFASHFRRLRIKTHTIAGNIALKDRTTIVEEFNNNPSGPPVMLLSLAAGGVGLNLIGGNHLFLTDMHWNPQLEAQACDRIYRVGQKKDVHIHRLVTTGTVEERILELQKKKLELAASILTGATKMAVTGLTLEDLKMLFNPTPPAYPPPKPLGELNAARKY